MYEPTVRARITFALPFHQDVGYLDAALRSVRAQSCPDWEAVVVDNAPTDLGAGGVVAKLRDPRIRYVRNPEMLPMGRNWNRCLELAETELVTVLHADDELEPRYVEAMLAAVDRHPEPSAFFCGVRLIDERGRTTHTAPDLFKRFLVPKPDARGETLLAGEAAARRLLRGNFLVVPSFCYRRDRLGPLRFSERWRFVTDLDVYLRLLLRGDVLLGIPDVVFDWRRHGETTTAQLTRTLERFREEAAFLDEMADTMAEAGWHDAAAEARRKTVRKLHLGFLAATDALRLRPRDAGAKLALMRRL
jgi:glycosyltransferase involved in cell wall biosynthesis